MFLVNYVYVRVNDIFLGNVPSNLLYFQRCYMKGFPLHQWF